MLTLTTPNGFGFDVLELQGLSTTLGFTHINLLNSKSLEMLLSQTGFEVVEICTPGLLDVDFVYRAYSDKNCLSRHGWLKNFLLSADDNTKCKMQEFLIDTNQSSHM